MTSRDRGIDARLNRIEKALQGAENKLHAMIGRKDIADETADLMSLHNKIADLVGEATDLHPVSDIGLASKARIVVRNYHLEGVGEPVLYSLVDDLQVKGFRRSRLNGEAG